MPKVDSVVAIYDTHEQAEQGHQGAASGWRRHEEPVDRSEGYGVVKYETAMKADQYLLLVHSTSDEVAIAKNIIQGTSHITYAVHSEPVYAF
jgi:hypothetical protein